MGKWENEQCVVTPFVFFSFYCFSVIEVNSNKEPDHG